MAEAQKKLEKKIERELEQIRQAVGNIKDPWKRKEAYATLRSLCNMLFGDEP